MKQRFFAPYLLLLAVLFLNLVAPAAPEVAKQPQSAQLGQRLPY